MKKCVALQDVCQFMNSIPYVCPLSMTCIIFIMVKVTLIVYKNILYINTGKIVQGKRMPYLYLSNI